MNQVQLNAEPRAPLRGMERGLRRRIRRARAAVDQADAGLDRKVLQEIGKLFGALNNPAAPRAGGQVWREFDKPEYLACVDAQGAPRATPAEVLEDYRRMAEQMPELAAWLREETDGRGRAVLLPARWLCHALGLRHGTTHLVLTTPEGEMVLQVRCRLKVEAPGCFDLPVAGHVDGLQSYAETLHKEAREELGLEIDVLSELKELGGYTTVNASPDGRMLNREYHRVYAARITRAEMARLRPDPQEVAAVFSLARVELEDLWRRFPASFAGGLSDTLRYFPPD